MPRSRRIISENGKYHIIIKGISEIILFRNDIDKDKFLLILKKYKAIFKFKVYAYCLMDTHAHILIAANGASISRIMQSINLSYAIYYNKKYKREGPVFRGRFKSKLSKKDKDTITMSVYIHNNPKDIKGYRETSEDYEFCSFGVYAGKAQNKYNILDPYVLLSYYGEKIALAKSHYYGIVKRKLAQKLKDDSINIKINDANLSEFEHINDEFEYVSGNTVLKRNISDKNIITYVSKKIGINSCNLYIKYNRNSCEFRAFCIYLMRCFGNLKYSEISPVIGNVTTSALSKLCIKGYRLSESNSDYNEVLCNFINDYPLLEV